MQTRPSVAHEGIIYLTTKRVICQRPFYSISTHLLIHPGQGNKSNETSELASNYISIGRQETRDDHQGQCNSSMRESSTEHTQTYERKDGLVDNSQSLFYRQDTIAAIVSYRVSTARKHPVHYSRLPLREYRNASCSLKESRR